MQYEFQVQNVKCNGCATAIKDGLGKNRRVQSVDVDVAGGVVSVTGTADIRDELSAALKQLGYPEKAA
ncbi:MAG: cation transporter [Gammaproteobacteria bacterium]|nr:cation transporter [Gammaproteobacteria bacterium]MCP5459425.1 cation transporter [Gammaproteobacteria bacterium]